MIMDEFEKWCENEGYAPSHEAFQSFYSEMPVGTFKAQELAWQIYQLQICVEGLIEDQEFSHLEAMCG